MTAHAANLPVALLRDAKGVYGVGVIRNVDQDKGPKAPELILRPDRVFESNTRYAALQMITGGFRHGPFQRTLEEILRRAIHHELLYRKGLPWPPKEDWRSLDPRRRLKSQQMYHGLRLRSLSVINGLISEALETAAYPKAAALARRFRMPDRYSIYCASAQSHRALQLTETFPALSLAIYARSWAADRGVPVGLLPEAVRLVEAGGPLRTIARLMRIPMAFRKVKPGAADLALSVVRACEDPRLVDAYPPDSLPMMKLWLQCLHLAGRVGPDFVEWTARHATKIAGTPQETLSILADLADWVRACHRASAANVGDPFLPDDEGEQLVVRRFSANMSLATVTRLSAAWHEAVAANMTARNSEFPEPWCSGGASADLDIVPITSSADLYREGKLMHHCAGTYTGRVHSGDCYIFSVRKDGTPLATLQLVRGETGVAIGQLRGACNAKPSKEVLRAANSWLRAQREFRIPERTPERRSDIDDDIPF